MSEAADVTSTLADLERKLRELERELTSIGRRRVPAEDAVPAEEVPAQDGAPASSPELAGRLVDETIEPAQPRAAAADELARPEAREPDRPEQHEPGRPSEAQLAGLAELRRFRDRLERFARELTDEYDALLSRVMSGLFSTSPATSMAPPPPMAPPAAPTSTAPSSPPAAALAAVPPVAAAPPPSSTAAPAAPAAPAAAQEETLFEGHVELGVGPFYDIDSLSAFERRLASLPNAIDASVRRFEASHAVVDLRLSAPVALVTELRRTLDTDFNVRQVAGGRLLLTFDEP